MHKSVVPLKMFYFISIVYYKRDNWRFKYTEVQSQHMTFTQSPPLLSNNPKILNNNLIFTVRLKSK